MASVSILGCGWLGLPLAKKLISDGFEVKGSTTSASKMQDLEKHGIEAFHIQLPDENLKPDFFQSDYLIINIPPKTSRAGVNHHFESIQSIIHLIPATQKIVYVSSTSVYPRIDYPINEEHAVDTDSERAQALVQVEQLLLNTFHNNLNILRLGGLLGYDRIPGKYFSGKSITQHQQRVNFIHRDDAIGIISTMLKQNKWGGIANGVAPKHPTKKEMYTKNAVDLNFTPPTFENVEQVLQNRIIEGGKIASILDYSFIYPDPMHFSYTN